MLNRILQRAELKDLIKQEAWTDLEIYLLNSVDETIDGLQRDLARAAGKTREDTPRRLLQIQGALNVLLACRRDGTSLIDEAWVAATRQATSISDHELAEVLK